MSGLLITGGSSYLGWRLVSLARSRHETCYTFYTQDPIGGPEGRQLDLRDGRAVQRLITEWQPDVIIHTAGSNRSPDMEKVIVDGATHLTAAATAVAARLIHLSTDSIFDGLQPPYRESDPPTPIHAYGRAKATAEEIVAGYPDHVIVRTSLIYGRERIDRSTEWITAALRQGEPVTLFTNQIRNPVWIDTLSLACLELAKIDYCGVLNVAGRQALSRADFGLKLLDWWGIDERESLTLAPSEGDRWPLDCRLDLSRATALLATPLLGVDEVLSTVDNQQPTINF